MRHAGMGALLLTAVALVPSVAEAVASAELYRTQAYVYGRFEARVRYAAGDGVISSFFLWKEGSELANAFWNELDFEKLGADCHMQTNAIYGNPESEHSQTNAMPGDICGGYHDYRFEWTPDYIAWAVDGREIRRDTGATATAFAQNAASGMTFHFNIWPGNANFGGNFSPSILPVHQFISWVEYSSYSNGSFQRVWREEFDGGTLPSGWATGNWASPYSLSTHNPANVRFANGIAILSLTADNATGFTGVPPADVTSAGGTGAGGVGAGGVGFGGTASGGVVNRGGNSGVGGTTAAGGASTNAGGKTAGVGGALVFSGGATTTGGMSNRGGTTTGSGGATVGGASSGGATSANGGASSGGVVTASGGTTKSVVGGATSAASGAAAQLSGGGPTSGVGNSSGLGGGVVTPSTAPPTEESGCGCRVVERTRSLPYDALGLVGLGVVLARRRRKHR